MAKRKSKPIESIIIAVTLVLLSVATLIYVYCSFRSTIIKNTLENEADRYFSVLYVDYDDTLLVSDCYGKGLVRKTPPTPTREDFDFLGWSMNDSLRVYSTAETYNMEITQDVLFKAIYQEKQLTVKYMTDDQTVIQSITYASSEKMPTIANPTKDGYLFTGWDAAVNGSVTTCVAMWCEEDSDYICRVNNTYYTDINEVITRFFEGTSSYEASLDIYLWRDFSITETINISGDYNNKTITIKLIDDVYITGYVERIMLETAVPLYIETYEYQLTLDNKQFSKAWYNSSFVYLRGNLELKQQYYAPNIESSSTTIQSRLVIESGSKFVGEISLDSNGLSQLVFEGVVSEENNIDLYIQAPTSSTLSEGIEMVKDKKYIISRLKLPEGIISGVAVSLKGSTGYDKYKIALDERLSSQGVYHYYLDLSSITEA